MRFSLLFCFFFSTSKKYTSASIDRIKTNLFRAHMRTTLHGRTAHVPFKYRTAIIRAFNPERLLRPLINNSYSTRVKIKKNRKITGARDDAKV